MSRRVNHRLIHPGRRAHHARIRVRIRPTCIRSQMAKGVLRPSCIRRDSALTERCGELKVLQQGKQLAELQNKNTLGPRRRFLDQT